jgi:hypothetical protein
MAEDEKIRFLIVRFVGDEMTALKSVGDGLKRAKGVRHVSTHATGRDPQPVVPAETALHVAALHDAGQHERAEHLENVGARHGDAEREIHNIVRTIIDMMPKELQIGGRPPSEYFAWLLEEKRMRTQAAADAFEFVLAILTIEQNILQRGDDFELADVLATIKQARAKAAVRIARNESAAQRREEAAALHARARSGGAAAKAADVA